MKPRSSTSESRAKRAWRRWQHIAGVVGSFQARVIFTIFYFILVTPIALVFKLLADPLQLRRKVNSYWNPISEELDPMAAARRQA